jgi:hypothetical protein
MEAGLDHNFHNMGRLLALLPLQLFKDAESGLVLVEGTRLRRITTPKELAPLLIDNIRISVTKNGKYHGERPSDSVLRDMLASRYFIANFKRVQDVVTTPVVLADHRPSQPGHNQGDILYIGPVVSIENGLEHINKFLDVMDFQSNADRTNAVAALLTVPFRHHFYGGKPLVLVTATKSHAGKGTLIDFIRSNTTRAEIPYEDKDWPMVRNLHDQLLQKPETGVINFDNVRTDSSGRGKFIRSSFVESFITNSEIVLSSANSRNSPLRTANKFVVLLNSNEGSLSIDLLNRSLPIRLNPTGDLSERIARAKASLGGDVKHEWLPAHRDQIEAERWGMIHRWVQAGKPLNREVTHPMGPWAQTIGEILLVNGFKDFLGNYGATRSSADPIREALTILAFHTHNKPKRAEELARLIVTQGLAKTLLKRVDPANIAAAEREVGVVLRPFVGETFIATTPSERITYRLTKKSNRWNGGNPHFRYTFEEVGREPVTVDDQGGIILEESSAGGIDFDLPVEET